MKVYFLSQNNDQDVLHAFITVTFEFINISSSDLGLAPFVYSLAPDKHAASLLFWSVGVGWGCGDSLDSD